MSKRKLYPDECPVFEVVGSRIWSCFYTKHEHVTGTTEGFNQKVIKCLGGEEETTDEWVHIFDLRPLTPAAVEMWEHVAGREWKP